MNFSHRMTLSVGAAALLALGGCGGGGGAGAVATTPQGADVAAVPQSAAASAQSFIDYQRSLAVSDVIEPLTLQQFLPPKDDFAEPIPLG